MDTISMKFPQFTRFFSASILLGSLGALFSLNLFALWQTHPAPAVLGTLTSPWSGTSHETLAHWYWQEGLVDQATRELHIAEQLSVDSTRSSQVLGATSYEALRKQWSSEKQNFVSALSYWQSIEKKYSNYRDAYIMLTVLDYQLGNLNDARAWLARAQTLDPNSPTVQSLTKLLE